MKIIAPLLLAAGLVSLPVHAQPALNDAQIAAIVVVANQVDIDAGQYVVAKTKNPDVTRFAATMVTDHSAVAGADARTHVVSIENMKFSPDVIHVRAGDVVVFKNRDLVPHTATAKTGKAFDSGILQSGGEWRFAPKPEGTIRYACAFHPMMEGVVIVERP